MYSIMKYASQRQLSCQVAARMTPVSEMQVEISRWKL